MEKGGLKFKEESIVGIEEMLEEIRMEKLKNVEIEIFKNKRGDLEGKCKMIGKVNVMREEIKGCEGEDLIKIKKGGERRDEKKMDVWREEWIGGFKRLREKEGLGKSIVNFKDCENKEFGNE